MGFNLEFKGLTCLQISVISRSFSSRLQHNTECTVTISGILINRKLILNTDIVSNNIRIKFNYTILKNLYHLKKIITSGSPYGNDIQQLLFYVGEIHLKSRLHVTRTYITVI